MVQVKEFESQTVSLVNATSLMHTMFLLSAYNARTASDSKAY